MKITNIAGTGRSFDCKKAIIKLGSNVVLGAEGRADVSAIENIADSILELRQGKVQIIVVTSGAIGLACSQLNRGKPSIIPEKQAMAAIGQIGLMHVYQGILAARGLTAAQLLLTRADMEDRRRYLNARHALEHLLQIGAVPIINENDTISTDELSFGDNDVLSAYVAVKMKADLLVLLSTVAGVMKEPPGNPGKFTPTETAEVIPVIERLDAKAFAGVDDSRSGHGSGGMRSKLMAAKAASDAGVHTIIAGGKKPGILQAIFSGSFTGTYIPAARDSSLSSLERWIGFGQASRGNRLTLDAGAVAALLNRKTSLLPVGVAQVAGKFAPGDIVDVCDSEGMVIARGLVNYASDEIERIKGHKTKEIEAILGHHHYDEIIHRDHLVVLR